MPVASKAWVVPIAKDGLAGLTEIEVNEGGAVAVTCNVAEPEIF